MIFTCLISKGEIIEWKHTIVWDKSISWTSRFICTSPYFRISSLNKMTFKQVSHVYCVLFIMVWNANNKKMLSFLFNCYYSLDTNFRGLRGYKWSTNLNVQRITYLVWLFVHRLTKPRNQISTNMQVYLNPRKLIPLKKWINNIVYSSGLKST